MENLLPDFLSGLISRTEGPLKFRFVLQPAMATILAIRDGLRDSRGGRPPFFWEFCTVPSKRRQLAGECWKSISKIFILAFVLDCVYQVIMLRWIYLWEALTVSIVLAVIPYVIVRGPVNRSATLRRRLASPATAAPPENPPSLKKAV